MFPSASSVLFVLILPQRNADLCQELQGTRSIFAIAARSPTCHCPVLRSVALGRLYLIRVDAVQWSSAAHLRYIPVQPVVAKWLNGADVL